MPLRCWNHWAQHRRWSKAALLGCDRPTCCFLQGCSRVGVNTSSKFLNEICLFFLGLGNLLNNNANNCSKTLKTMCIAYNYVWIYIYICVFYWLLLASVHFDVQFVFWPWSSSGPTFSKGLRRSRDGPQPRNSPVDLGAVPIPMDYLQLPYQNLFEWHLNRYS